MKEELTAEEQKEVEEEEVTSRLRRTDPAAYHALKVQQEANRAAHQAELFAQSSARTNGGHLSLFPMVVNAHPPNSLISPYDAGMPPSFTAPPLANQSFPPSQSRDPLSYSTGPDGLNGSSGINAPWPTEPSSVGQWMKGYEEEVNAAAVKHNSLPVLGANTMMALETVASSTPQAANKRVASGINQASQSRQAFEEVAIGTFAPKPPLQSMLTKEEERSKRG